MRLKSLTNKQKEQEIESLKKLVEKYKKEASRPGRRKREIIPFELEIGNFCCVELHKRFKEGEHEFAIFWLADKYRVHLLLKDSCGNYCPYCKKHIDEFFYIKEY